jgi:hypothetical protein
MRIRSFDAAAIGFLIVLAAVCSTSSPAQQPAGGQPPIVKTTTLSKGYLLRPYRFEMRADGGITPLKWQMTSGALPAGVVLGADGVLGGIPTQTGDFSFAVTVTDSDIPPHRITQEFTLLVVTPLVVRWSRVPKVNGTRVDGSIKVSNQTGEDFDLTMIVLAVNEIGRATAIGYQHFPLQKETLDFEIPFGENLPNGSYNVNVDVVAEVAASNSIYRARLVTNIKLLQGP